MTENSFSDLNGYLPYQGEQPKDTNGKPLSYFDIQVRDFEKNKGQPATPGEVANIELKSGY